MTRRIELSAGTIEYEDSGGEGPAIVLLGGLMMDASLWEQVIADLSPEHRCVAPTLPLGAHRHAMHADADLTPRGLARLVAEFLDRLELDDVTLVGNDTGGALVQLLAGDGATRVGRIVLVSCDAFENFPPGLTGKTLVLSGKLSPTMFGLFMQQMRFRPLRRLPLAFGWLTMRGDAATARWIKPILNSARSAATPCESSAGSPHNRISCSTPPNACPASSAPPSSCGQAKIASCRPSTAAASPNCSHTDGCSRYPTATHSSPSTSRPALLRPSSTSRARHTQQCGDSAKKHRAARAGWLRGAPRSATDPTRGAFTRVVHNHGGSEYLFTLFSPDGISETAIARQMATVEDELETVRSLRETEAGRTS